MLIIGKILEENLMSLATRKISAHNGKPKISYKLTRMVAKMNIDASIHMDGKNKSIILLFIKWMLASRLKPVQNYTVLIITMKKKRDNL
jgi:hypothetical protein